MMHEIFHGICDVYGLEWSLKTADYQWREDAEEFLAWFMTTAVLALVNDNPGLIEFLATR